VLERLDLRVPSLEHLRLSAMIDAVRAAIDRADGDAIVIGSSLGGLTAARVAEREPRVRALVLLAPAFQLAARWREQLGAAWDDWRATGWRAITDYTTGAPARVDFGFVEDVATIDVGFPDVRVPTLIFHGRADDTVPVAHSRRFAEGRPHVRLVELDDGHELVASLPAILDDSERFLAQLASSG
jgi:pimeloyl-ACP methyl ester carboxylesterase